MSNSGKEPQEALTDGNTAKNHGRNAVQSDEHGRRVSGMFGRIARWYDFLNHFLSLGQDIYWRYRLVRLLRPVDAADERFAVLDLAAGTLDVSLEIRRQHPKARILAMDFSLPMLKRGREKSQRKGAGVETVLADGKRLPLPDACVDCITVAFGIRNIIPRAEAFAEAHRVLRPGGRLCVLEFGSGKNRIWRGIYNFLSEQVAAVGGGALCPAMPALTAIWPRPLRLFPTAEVFGRRNAGCGIFPGFLSAHDVRDSLYPCGR